MKLEDMTERRPRRLAYFVNVEYGQVQGRADGVVAFTVRCTSDNLYVSALRKALATVPTCTTWLAVTDVELLPTGA